MKILSIIAGTFLFTAVQVCGCENCKVNAQATVKAVIKEELRTVKLKITGLVPAVQIM
jgi:hypothetical protein